MVATVLFIPDCHIPYENKKHYDLMLEIGKDANPQEVVILGDYADFYDINSHGKSPDITDTLQEEVFQVCERLKELKRTFKKAKITYIEGNHEHRLTRFIASKCPEMYGVVDLKIILELAVMDINFIPYGPYQAYRPLGGDIIARHEPVAGGASFTMGTLRKAMNSVFHGHTHQIQESNIVDINGNEHTCVSCGFLGDKHHPLFNYVKSHHNWQSGFVLGHFYEDHFFHQIIRIKNNKAHFRGSIYEYE